jgi:hypothetical protein
LNTKATAMSRIEIREFARVVRKMFGLDESLYFPIVEVLEFVIPQIIEDFSFEIVTHNELPNAYAITKPDKKIMKVRQDVYERAINNSERDRFTLCHELGHLLLHDNSNISFARGDTLPFENPEWQANTFAAELLAPYHLVKGMNVDEIAEKCVMSRTAADIQYKKYNNF